MSDANRVILRYVPETTYGETPADSADWKEVRFTGESLSASPEQSNSSEIRSDRQIADAPTVSASTSGDISFELSPQSFDDFIASAMMNDWDDTSGELVTGTTESSYSIEKAFTDIERYINFKGMRVDTMSLEMSYGSIITGSFGLAGAGATTPAVSIVGAGTSAAPLSTEVFVGSSDVGSVTIDGAPADICISTLSLNVSNSHRAINCIGNLYPKNQKAGTSNVTGSATVYLGQDSFELYKDSLESGRVALSYAVTDGTNTYLFELPRLTLQVDAPQAGSLDSDVELTVNFTAIYDPVEETNLRITRTPV